MRTQAVAAQGRPQRHAPKWLAPALFLAPAIALLTAFLIYPLIESLHLSLLEWNGLGKGRIYVGLDNWSALLRDGQFRHALGNNLLLALMSVLVQLPIALALALLLDKAGRGSRTLKILYFLPLLFSSVALGVVFKNIFDPHFGPVNTALNAVGATALAQDWLGDRRFALVAVTLVVCWQNIPFYMILLLAGLASFPSELREAATLDGASEATIFWKIKLPHLRGTLRTAAMLAVIGSLRYFDLIYVMTGGGPEGASELMATYMYRTVFSSFQLGYGSTVALAMFLVVTLIAAAGMRLTKRFETQV
ncbi:carbohydrate ABC transporter permease [Verminephrobacter aporrectodeae]|uniref:carbohydrate ABC transporter permease n=1 Tax=Verminephrobacter aporrectodeae TaxID=1110389 RepID=UPI0022375BF9|nr:sugar ABC transporter permease [Verminephrobacter aporrectodeae]